MKARALLIAPVLVFGGAASAAEPPEDAPDVSLDDLLDAEDAFVIAAEAAGHAGLTGLACGIVDDAATCYGSLGESVVRGEADWAAPKVSWTFTEFGTGTAETPAGTGEQGTRENPTPIGIAAPVGYGWTATVNSVNLDATDAVMAANQFNDPPVEGSQYVVVNVTVTYDGEEASDTGGVNFSALGPSNVVFDAGGSTYATPPAPLEQFTEVFKGGSLTGDVLFEIPASDVNDLVFIGHAFMSFDDAERSFFASA